MYWDLAISLKFSCNGINPDCGGSRVEWEHRIKFGQNKHILHVKWQKEKGGVKKKGGLRSVLHPF